MVRGREGGREGGRKGGKEEVKVNKVEEGMEGKGRSKWLQHSL